MTAEQEKMIRNFRAAGFGYKAIASRVNLPRDTVRYYCKTHSLAGHAPAVRMNFTRMEEDGAVCTYCGAPITQPSTGRPKKFCSDACRMKWWAVNRDKIKKSGSAVYLFRCQCCGREFSSYGNKDRKYCSRECYIKGRFWKDAPGGEPPKDVMGDFSDAEAKVIC